MLVNLPIYLMISFLATVLLTLLFLIITMRLSAKATIRKRTGTVALILLIWIGLQSGLTLVNLYNSDPTAVPPKIAVFGVLPALVAILMLFLTKKGRTFIDGLPVQQLTYLHVVRVPVELVLYGLYIYGAIPQLMTFEGRNFDIIAGISAPFVAYLGIARGRMTRNGLLAWNLVCLGLLINIVINAILSVPSPFQQFAFDQPNVAVLNFPYSLLPTFVVPVVLFSHLASIRQLLKRKEGDSNNSKHFYQSGY